MNSVCTKIVKSDVKKKRKSQQSSFRKEKLGGVTIFIIIHQDLFTEIGKGAAPFPVKLICCHGEGLAEPVLLITEYSEVFASLPAFPLVPGDQASAAE